MGMTMCVRSLLMVTVALAVSGGGALAAPIKEFSGKTVAVMDILTPEHRYTAKHREHCIEMLLDGARRASERLGYRGEAQSAAVAPRRPRT